MQAKSEQHNDLTYPFGMGQAPASGQTFEVVEGVHWLSMPLPMVLDRINLWLLEDGDEWVIVDTGLHTSASKDVWNSVIDNVLDGRRVSKIIVTHMHPDHIGMAGWLTEKFACDLWMSEQEFTTCQQFIAGIGEQAEEIFTDFYVAAGAIDKDNNPVKARASGYSRIIYPLPDSYHRLQEGDTLTINGREWHIVTGNGHSPEHVCLHCPSLNALLSGDQAISRISSNISVWPFEPEANPLQQWLNSCRDLQNKLPNDLLILPAHQEPFYGLHARLNQLIDGHEEGLERLYEYLATPKTATECFSVLFKRKFNDDINLMAVGESLAHLNYLLSEQRIKKQKIDGINYYQQA